MGVWSLGTDAKSLPVIRDVLQALVAIRRGLARYSAQMSRFDWQPISSREAVATAVMVVRRFMVEMLRSALLTILQCSALRGFAPFGDDDSAQVNAHTNTVLTPRQSFPDGTTCSV